MRVAIFAATVWEFRAVQAAVPGGRLERCAGKPLYVAPMGCGECWVMQTGMGLQQAGTSARALLQRVPFSLSLSTGFACALTSAGVGDVLMGTQVSLVEGTGLAATGWLESAGVGRERLMKVLRAGAPEWRCVEGPFISVNRVVGRGEDKITLARHTGAIGLDMESAALAGEARAARVPFAMVRTVSDVRDEDLPLDFNLFLRPTGWLKGIATVVTNPGCLVGLARLRRQSLAAGHTLSRCLQSTLSQLFTDSVGSQVPTIL